MNGTGTSRQLRTTSGTELTRVAEPTRSKRDPRRAYRVVDQFEEELADYTGAPFAVAVDSCTNAIYAALMYERARRGAGCVVLPRRTYVGVLQAALNAGMAVDWHDMEWSKCYFIDPTSVVDSARHLARKMYLCTTLTCLSFHAAKQLPLGRGGAILTDSEDAYNWLRRFRTDGRAPGDTGTYATFPAAHIYLPPDAAARGLWILSRWNDAGIDPSPLPADDYYDLSAIDRRQEA